MDNELLTLMKTYLPEWIISVVILTLVILFLIKKISQTVTIEKIFDYFKQKKFTQKELNSHQFFIFINYMKNYKIYRMEFGDAGRTKIFRDYFKIRCETFETNTKKILDGNLKDLTTIEIKGLVLDTLYTSLSESHKNTINQCSNDEERFVVNYVVEKFSNYSNSSIEGFKEVIENIFDTELGYGCNLERINAMLNIFLFVFVATFAESEKILHQLNGQLSGKYYKGVLIT